MKYQTAILCLLVLTSCGRMEQTGSRPVGLTDAESRLMTIRVPEIDFRSANVFDMLLFLDHSVERFGSGQETNRESRVRIIWTSDLEQSTPEQDFRSYLPPRSEDTTILESLKTIVDGSGLQYTVSNQWVIVDLKQERMRPTR